jgi:hypothetical protein
VPSIDLDQLAQTAFQMFRVPLDTKVQCLLAPHVDPTPKAPEAAQAEQ